MRTTLSIDEDILLTAKHLAERENQTLGEVVSRLARAGLRLAMPEAGEKRNGIPLLPKGVKSVTPALVNQLRDELV